MELILTPVRVHTRVIENAFLGSVFIALCSLIWIPTLPVAVTLQTFALCLLALVLPPHICLGASLLYLIEASLGLPVLCGCSNPLWFLGPCAGYLFAFPIASYAMSFFAYRSDSLIYQGLALLLGLVIIYAFGWLILSLFIGKAAAFQSGVFLFVPIDTIKAGFAIASVRYLKLDFVHFKGSINGIF